MNTGNGDDNDTFSTSAQKRKRVSVTRATPAQLSVLRRAYEDSRTPSQQQIKAMAEEAGLTPKWISQWFGRQRTKNRKVKETPSKSGASSSAPDSRVPSVSPQLGLISSSVSLSSSDPIGAGGISSSSGLLLVKTELQDVQTLSSSHGFAVDIPVPDVTSHSSSNVSGLDSTKRRERKATAATKRNRRFQATQALEGVPGTLTPAGLIPLDADLTGKRTFSCSQPQKNFTDLSASANGSGGSAYTFMSTDAPTDPHRGIPSAPAPPRRSLRPTTTKTTARSRPVISLDIPSPFLVDVPPDLETLNQVDSDVPSVSMADSAAHATAQFIKSQCPLSKVSSVDTQWCYSDAMSYNPSPIDRRAQTRSQSFKNSSSPATPTGSMVDNASIASPQQSKSNDATVPNSIHIPGLPKPVNLEVLDPSRAPLKHLMHLLDSYKSENGVYFGLLLAAAVPSYRKQLIGDLTSDALLPFEAAMGLSLLSKLGLL